MNTGGQGHDMVTSGQRRLSSAPLNHPRKNLSGQMKENGNGEVIQSSESHFFENENLMDWSDLLARFCL